MSALGHKRYLSQRPLCAKSGHPLREFAVLPCEIWRLLPAISLSLSGDYARCIEVPKRHRLNCRPTWVFEGEGMAKFVFGMNQSLDGYVDHLEMRPGPALFRHFVEHVRDLAGSVYGRRTYEIMRYWDEDRTEWSAEQHEFAAAWRSQPKWVVSRSLKSVGPNATLVSDDIEAVIRGLKARLVGEIAVSGPDLARSLTDLGLIDEYRLYFHPVVLGRGKPFFAGPRPPLRLVSTDPVGEDTIRLTYAPA